MWTLKENKNLLDIAHCQIATQRRSLKNAIVRTYNWLHAFNLLPFNLNTLSKSSVKRAITNIAYTFLSNSSEIFMVHF